MLWYTIILNDYFEYIFSGMQNRMLVILVKHFLNHFVALEFL